MTLAAPREARIVDSIMALLKSRGAWAVKVHGSGYGRAGVPDVIAVYLGRALALEVKRPGGAGASALQLRELAAAKEAGAISAVVRSRAEVVNLLEMVRMAPQTPSAASGDVGKGKTLPTLPKA